MQLLLRREAGLTDIEIGTWICFIAFGGSCSFQAASVLFFLQSCANLTVLIQQRIEQFSKNVVLWFFSKRKLKISN